MVEKAGVIHILLSYNVPIYVWLGLVLYISDLMMYDDVSWYLVLSWCEYPAYPMLSFICQVIEEHDPECFMFAAWELRCDRQSVKEAAGSGGLVLSDRILINIRVVCMWSNNDCWFWTCVFVHKKLGWYFNIDINIGYWFETTNHVVQVVSAAGCAIAHASAELKQEKKMQYQRQGEFDPWFSYINDQLQELSPYWDTPKKMS